MTSLDRAILAHIFNSKTQPVSLDELVRVTNAERTEVLLAIGELHGKGYLEIQLRMKPYGMAMTFLSCVVRDAGKNKFGRCGESAGSEQKKAAASAGADFNAPPLSNEQRPIQVSCGLGGSSSLPVAKSRESYPTPAGKHFALSSAQGVESGKGAESPISAPQIQAPTMAEGAVVARIEHFIKTKGAE